MKRMILLMAMFVFICFASNCQNKEDVESKFKMLLFLNLHTHTTSYVDFENYIDLNLDTLEVSGETDYTESVFAPRFEFYKIILSESIIYNVLKTPHIQFEGFSQGYSNVYIIGVNLKNNRTYRLQGFDSNDFLAFLSDFIEEYNNRNDDKITTKKFLKYYKVQGLDFNCLYKGLKQDLIDRKKSPCLIRVEDPITIR